MRHAHAPRSTRHRHAPSLLATVLLLPALSLSLAGCGDEPLDAQGQSLAESAGRAVAGMESTSCTGWVLSGVDLNAGANRDSINLTARILDDVLGRCVVATAHPAPALGITVGFVAGGCGIPLTPIQFSGSMVLDFTAAPGGGSTIALRFHALSLLDTVLDGGLVLSASSGAFSYDAMQLRVKAQGQDVTIAGRGTMATESLHTSMVFDGNGMITTDKLAAAFTASDLHRKIRDCYPNQGTLALRTTELGITQQMTLRFDEGSADSGKVKVDWAGREHEWYLPARGCTDR